MNRLAVYCGSASPQDPRFIQLAYDVGKGLAQRGIGVLGLALGRMQGNGFVHTAPIPSC